MNNMQKKTDIDATCQQLGRVLSDLSEDARVLQELSNLKRCCQNRRLSSSGAWLENGMSKLDGLPRLVSELEDQFSLLSVVIREEESALQELEQNMVQVRQQNKILGQFVSKLPDHNKQVAAAVGPDDSLRVDDDDDAAAKTTTESSSNRSVTMSPRPRSSSGKKSPHRNLRATPTEKPATPASATPTAAAATSTPVNSGTLRSIPILVSRVTADEFQSVPKTIRGRTISLAMVNEALEEIKQVCKHKYDPASVSRRKRQARFDYCSKLDFSPHRLPNNHITDPWISEHDLRQKCAFFRQEATARTALQILRTLGRFRQVPCKHGTVLYCLTPPKASLTFTC